MIKYALLLLVGAFLFEACGQELSAYEMTKISTKDIVVDERIDVNKDKILNMRGQLSKDANQTIMTFNSPAVYRHDALDSSYIEFIGGIKGIFFTNNKPSGDIEADYGIYYKEKKKMYLKKNVKLVNSKGDVLKAEDLWWDQATHRINTDRRISFLQEGAKLYGEGLDADENMNDYTVKKFTGKIENGSL